MKTHIAELRRRFEALSTRERALVAGCVWVVLAYVGATFFVMPAIEERDRLAAEVAQLQLQMAQLDTAIASAERKQAPGARRAHREALTSQVLKLDEEMRVMHRTLVAPSEMAGLLKRVLALNRRLKLVSLRNLPVERLETGEAKTAGATGARPIYRHGVQIKLAGAYADLHAYLAQLERMPWQVYWGRLEVETRDYPVLIATLTVHTLSLDKAWLTV